MEPLVSIIIPTCNCGRWVGQAIDSAVAQTYPRCEIIVVDDGSTDGTGEWVQAHYGSRINYHWQPNGGVARARNTGLALAQGEYIQFLDADDLLLPGKVACQVSFLEAHPEWAMAYCDNYRFEDDNPSQTIPWSRRDRYGSGHLLDRLVDSGFFLTHSALVQTEWVRHIGGFDENLPSNEDWDFFLRLAAAGAQFAYYPDEPLVLYRSHSGSRSSTHIKHGLSGILVLQKLEQAIGDPEERKRLRIRQAIGNWRFAYGRALFEDGRRLAGWKEMSLGLLQDRRSLKYRIGYMLLCPWLGASRADQLLTRVSRNL